MYICKFCGKQFEKQQSLAGHQRACKKHYISSDDLIEESRILQCKHCGKEFNVTTTKYNFNIGKYNKYCCISCANARQHSNETKTKISNSISVYFETHKQAPKVKEYICKYCGKLFFSSDTRDITSKIYCSKECKHKYLSEHTGGYRRGSGKGKSGRYKGIHCDSTWELAFLIYHLDNNLYISRCKEYREYTYNGKTYKYIPDFVTENGIIEIKGYSSKQWQAKLKQNTDIIVLYKDDVLPYINYCKNKYNVADLTDLYDDKIHVEKDYSKNKYVWINKDGKNTMVYPKYLQEYIDNGWNLGRKKHK